jgi:hypothetical protein
MSRKPLQALACPLRLTSVVQGLDFECVALLAEGARTKRLTMLRNQFECPHWIRFDGPSCLAE